ATETAPGVIELRLVCGDAMPNEQETAAIADEVKRGTSGFSVNVLYVDRVLMLPNAKTLRIIPYGYEVEKAAAGHVKEEAAI
ncbi:MAG: hypothetical protein JXB33_06415, partial [Clostridia bacterium]|nr:hypothetical protein [Clostridia bacterium]